MQANAKEKRKKNKPVPQKCTMRKPALLSASGFDSFRIWGKPGGTQTLARWRGQVETMTARFVANE